MKTETLIIRMDKDLKSEIQKAAKQSRRSVSDYARLVIENAVKQKQKV